MTIQQTISHVLSQSLADDVLNNTERQELKQLLASLADHEKNFLRNQAFDLAQEKVANGEPAIKILRWLEKVVKSVSASQQSAEVTSRAYFSPGRDCRDVIIRLLDKAQHRVDICVFTISDDRITEAIITAHRRNVPVRVVTDNDKAFDKGSDIHLLQDKGVPVAVDTSPSHMHHKFALVDNQLINGSFNWTRSATKYNEENIVISDNSQLIEQFDQVFAALWQQFSP